MKLFPDVRVSLGRMGLFLLAALLATGSAINVRRLGAASRQQAPAKDAAALIESFRHVEVASVSDALEQTLGKKLYMTHRMRGRAGRRLPQEDRIPSVCHWYCSFNLGSSLPFRWR